MIKRGLLLFATFLMLLLASSQVVAEPNGVDEIDRHASQRGATGSAVSQQAAGGNVTGLDINGTSITERWQGFFGNVTGGITLEDASSNIFYDWADTDPSGEIFAANSSSITWDNLNCVNFSSDGTDTESDRYDADSLNDFIGYTSASDRAKKDSVNGTFNQSFTGTLEVASQSFTAGDNCSMVTLHQNGAYQTTNFQELLMTDNVSIIFTAILESDTTGFDGVAADFQMIVGVNGTGTNNDNVRDYFFFVELS